MSMIDKLFNEIDPVALEVYKGKRVLFLVPPIAPLKYDGKILEPEHLSIAQQRRYVRDVVLAQPEDRIVVVTDNPFILSDAFASQIYVGEAFNPVFFPTFGAEPGRIVLAISDETESIGALSDETLKRFLDRKDWDRKSLKMVVNAIGGGWPRAKLRELLDKMEA